MKFVQYVADYSMREKDAEITGESVCVSVFEREMEDYWCEKAGLHVIFLMIYLKCSYHEEVSWKSKEWNEKCVIEIVTRTV